MILTYIAIYIDDADCADYDFAIHGAILDFKVGDELLVEIEGEYKAAIVKEKINKVFLNTRSKDSYDTDSFEQYYKCQLKGKLNETSKTK